MRTPTHSRPEAARGFTLIELLGVILIMSILIGLAAVALKDSSPASKREQGARQLAAALQQARVEAITISGRTAVVFAGPGAGGVEGAGVTYGIFRLQEGVEDPVAGEMIGRWRTLPGGTVFSQRDDLGAPNLLTEMQDQLEVTMPEGAVVTLPCVILSPEGRVISPQGQANWALAIATGGVQGGVVQEAAGDVATLERVLLRRSTGRARRLP